MKVFAALLIVAFAIQGTFAVTSLSTQSKLLIEKINVNMEKSHLGRALKNMVQIANTLGYNYNDLYDAFSALKNNLLNRLDEEQKLFSLQTASHEGAVASFNAAISKFSAEIVDGETQLINLNHELTEYQVNLKVAEDQLASDKKFRQLAQDQLEHLEERYEIETTEYAEVKLVIAEALQKLREAQSHYESAQLEGFSFVQIQNHFSSFAQKITSVTEKLPAKHQLFIKPVIASMLSVDQSVGQSSIQVAIDALQNLQDYFDQQLNELTSLYVTFKQNFQTTIEQLTQAIDVLENEVIPYNQQQIHLLETQITVVQQALDLSRANLKAAQDGLAAENEAFARIEARHNALVERVNFEYNLVEQAERIIRNAQANLE